MNDTENNNEISVSEIISDVPNNKESTEDKLYKIFAKYIDK